MALTKKIIKRRNPNHPSIYFTRSTEGLDTMYVHYNIENREIMNYSNQLLRGKKPQLNSRNWNQIKKIEQQLAKLQNRKPTYNNITFKKYLSLKNQG